MSPRRAPCSRTSPIHKAVESRSVPRIGAWPGDCRTHLTEVLRYEKLAIKAAGDRKLVALHQAATVKAPDVRLRSLGSV